MKNTTKHPTATAMSKGFSTLQATGVKMFNIKQYIMFLRLFLSIIVLLGFCGCNSSNSTDLQNEMQSIVHIKWLAYANDNMGGNGSIAICITSPKGDYFLKSGNTSSEITTDSHFRAASTTKTFTAAAIMLLYQQGMLDIDDKLTDLIPNQSNPYLPDTPAYAIPYKDEITIKALLEHRAGVFDLTNTDIPKSVPPPLAGERYETYIRKVLGQEHQFTLEELISVVSVNQIYTDSPGVKFAYSDTGYTILGKIIEEVSGKSYHDFIRDNFFTPYSLNRSSMPYLGNDWTMPSPFISGDIWYDNHFYSGLSEESYSTYNNVSASVAQGNLVTTLENLNRWVRGWLTGNMGLTPETVAMMKEVIPTGEYHQFYGLGTIYTPGLGYGHNGAITGYLTIMRYDPQSDIAVTAIVNIWNMDNFYSMAGIAFDILSEITQLLE